MAPLAAQSSEGVIARCGASEGQGYFFHDPVMNPEGPDWSKDGISSGRIVLVRLGDEWDIQFDDIAGAYGYREDGARVIPLGGADNLLTVGAFRGTYVDIYTFNFAGNEVLWTSHKIGTAIGKVAIYRAECTFTGSATN
ncbi:MAG: hypothetical protein NXH83_01600 [Rhodobacteraceae bacterium]|nr:hypothetical protein [Paracoccaceae bacterium]